MKVKKVLHQKGWILRGAVFLTLLSFLFVNVSYLVRPIDTDRRNYAGYYALEKNTLDALYIGGSAGFVYWAPMLAWEAFGFTSYALGNNSMAAETMQSTIAEALKTQSPSLLMLDLRPFQYRQGKMTEVPFRNFTDNVKYSPSRFQFILKHVPGGLEPGQPDNVLDYLFDISKYHTRWKELKKDSWIYSTNQVENPNKGFHFVAKHEALNSIDCRSVTEQTPVSAETDQLFTELLNYCSGLKQQVLFLTNSYVETPEHRGIYNYLEQRITAQGLGYLNTNRLNDEIGMDYATDFYNDSHVNIFGAEKYTRFVAQYIETNYDLPDKRTSDAYDSWNADLKIWYQNVEQTKKKIEEKMTLY